MGYERNYRRYGSAGESGFDRNRYSGGQGYEGGNDDRARSYGDYGAARGNRDDDRFQRGRDDRSYYGQGRDDSDRGFFDRAGDEVRSWFGDEDAERRRQQDERYERSADRGNETRNYGYQGQNSQGSQGYRSRHEHDPHYRTWRDRQMESLDRDYDDYRQEHQSRFDSEFGSWRQQRQGQRDLLNKVQEHQEVVGSDGEHIGTVDHVRGDRILLTKNDQAAGGHHHSIPCGWVQSVDDKIIVNKSADQAKQHWRDEQRNSEGGLFGNGDRSGSTNLNRSFSGTY
jgi:hypothetical protein